MVVLGIWLLYFMVGIACHCVFYKYDINEYRYLPIGGQIVFTMFWPVLLLILLFEHIFKTVAKFWECLNRHLE